MKSFVPILALLLASCASSPGDAGDEAEITAKPFVPGNFKLYPTRRAEPNLDCDLFTKLVLTSADGPSAHLESSLSGTCELALFPSARDYALKEAAAECGSRVYEGVSGDAKITITDHRARMCKNIVPAKIVVEETRPSADGLMKVTLYSYDAPHGD